MDRLMIAAGLAKRAAEDNYFPDRPIPADAPTGNRPFIGKVHLLGVQMNPEKKKHERPPPREKVYHPPKGEEFFREDAPGPAPKPAPPPQARNLANPGKAIPAGAAAVHPALRPYPQHTQDLLDRMVQANLPAEGRPVAEPQVSRVDRAIEALPKGASPPGRPPILRTPPPARPPMAGEAPEWAQWLFKMKQKLTGIPKKPVAGWPLRNWRITAPVAAGTALAAYGAKKLNDRGAFGISDKTFQEQMKPLAEPAQAEPPTHGWDSLPNGLKAALILTGGGLAVGGSVLGYQAYQGWKKKKELREREQLVNEEEEVPA